MERLSPQVRSILETRLPKGEISNPCKDVSEGYSATAAIAIFDGSLRPFAKVTADGATSIDWHQVRTSAAKPMCHEDGPSQLAMARGVARLLLRALEDGQDAGVFIERARTTGIAGPGG